jgi:hypothetical protein
MDLLERGDLQAFENVIPAGTLPPWIKRDKDWMK